MILILILIDILIEVTVETFACETRNYK